LNEVNITIVYFRVDSIGRGDKLNGSAEQFFIWRKVAVKVIDVSVS